MASRSPVLVCAELRVRHVERAVRFYRALGLRAVARGTMSIGEKLVWLRDPVSGQVVELYFVPRGSRFDEPFRSVRRFDTRLLFAVRDLGTVLARLRRLGATVRVSFDDGETRLVFLEDPDGNLVELAGWAPSVRDKHRDLPLMGLVRPPKRRRV